MSPRWIHGLSCNKQNDPSFGWWCRLVEDDEAVVVEADLTEAATGPVPDIPRDRSAPGEAGFRSAYN
jgi:hypothetical protein